jgi:hypothetical protein
MDKFYIEENGSISFLVEAPEIAQIRKALDRQNVRIIEETDAVFNAATDKVYDIDLNVDGTIEDIEFALQDLIKFVRPNYHRPH